VFWLLYLLILLLHLRVRQLTPPKHRILRLTVQYLLIVDVQDYCVTWSHTDTTHSVGLLWKRDRPVAKTTNNSHKRQISVPSEGFEPAIPGSERPQTSALDRSATGIESENLHNVFIFHMTLFIFVFASKCTWFYFFFSVVQSNHRLLHHM